VKEWLITRSESIYIHDPDNNRIEFYIDRLPSGWKWTSANKIRMVTEASNVNNLLNYESYGQWKGFMTDG
jgi:catechol 2,3-dioxygenase